VTTDPYATLGIPRTASAADIERAYRECAMRAHPDRGGTHRAMRELNAARKILVTRAKDFADPSLDPIKRLVSGKSLQDIQRIRDDIRGHVRSFEQRNRFGDYGGPLNSPRLARHRLELQYIDHILS
jgi:curved DNA-binding protein CbpA